MLYSLNYSQVIFTQFITNTSQAVLDSFLQNLLSVQLQMTQQQPINPIKFSLTPFSFLYKLLVTLQVQVLESSLVLVNELSTSCIHANINSHKTCYKTFNENWKTKHYERDIIFTHLGNVICSIIIYLGLDVGIIFKDE